MKITTILIIILLTGCSPFSQQIEELQRLKCAEASSTLCAGIESND